MALTKADINTNLCREFGIDAIYFHDDYDTRKELIVLAAADLVKLERGGASNSELEAARRTLCQRVVVTFPDVFYEDPDRRIEARS